MDQLSVPSQTAVGARQVVLVCGMHRSGTSALTRVCNLLGGALPGPLVEPAVGNELGHWEPAAVVAMNDRALLAARSNVNSVFPVSSSWLRSKAAEDFTDEIKAYVAGLGDAPVTWFVKDPRISVLAGLWRDGVAQTGRAPRFVIAFRNPWEVAASLSKRQLHHFPDEVWPLERGLALWLNYMLTIERKTRGLPRSFVSYEGLLGDWRRETARLYDQIGLDQPLPSPAVEAEIDGFIKPDERHARHDALQTRGGLAMSVYQTLHARLHDPQGGEAAFDEAGAAFIQSFDVLGGYLNALEARARDFGPLKARALAANAETKALEQAVETLELRLIHLTGQGMEDALSNAPLSDAAALQTALDIDELHLLRKKHAALSAAHRRNVETLQAKGAELEAEAQRRIEALNVKLDDKDTAIAALTAAVAMSEQTGRLLRHQAAALRGHLGEVEGKISEREQPAQQRLSQALAEARAEIDLMRQSRSWKITKPLRALTMRGARR